MPATALPFDAALGMFVEPPHQVDLHHVEFMRWRVEHGRAGQGVSGPSSGVLVKVPDAEPIVIGGC